MEIIYIRYTVVESAKASDLSEDFIGDNDFDLSASAPDDLPDGIDLGGEGERLLSNLTDGETGTLPGHLLHLRWIVVVVEIVDLLEVVAVLEGQNVVEV